MEAGGIEPPSSPVTMVFYRFSQLCTDKHRNSRRTELSNPLPSTLNSHNKRRSRKHLRLTASYRNNAEDGNVYLRCFLVSVVAYCVIGFFQWPADQPLPASSLTPGESKPFAPVFHKFFTKNPQPTPSIQVLLPKHPLLLTTFPTFQETSVLHQ